VVNGLHSDHREVAVKTEADPEILVDPVGKGSYLRHLSDAGEGQDGYARLSGSRAGFEVFVAHSRPSIAVHISTLRRTAKASIDGITIENSRCFGDVNTVLVLESVMEKLAEFGLEPRMLD
jgi:hypothetical protein